MVTIGGIPAPLIVADGASGQINLQVPFELQGASQADIMVNNNGSFSVPATVMLASASPAIFTLSQNGTGPGAILHSDYSVVSSSSPAHGGEVLLIYATGLGAVQNSVADGAAASGPDSVTNAVTVQIGGQVAAVQYAGLAPGFAGLYQINVTVPQGVASGDALVVVQGNGVSGSGQATVAVQ